MTGWGGDRADSAGLPWDGRVLSDPMFATDDGTADPAVRAALSDVAASPTPAALVVLSTLLLDARLLVPVVAEVVDGVVPSQPPAPAGRGDHGASMSVPLLGIGGGGTALPAFSGVDALSAWDPAARPVPARAVDVAQAALSEGCSRLVLDPAGPAAVALDVPVVLALASGHAWRPAWEDAAVVEALAGLVADLGEPDVVRGLRALPVADPTGVGVGLDLVPGLPADRLSPLVARLGALLAGDEVVASRATSVRVVLRAVAERRTP